MDSASISALAVVGGSLLGALTSLASTWLTRQQQDRRELPGTRIDNLIPIYSLFGRIRLSSSETVATAAEKVYTKSSPNTSAPN